MTDDEQDALAANCPLCWARPGQSCQVLVKNRPIARWRRHPHPERIRRARDRGILGGAGRELLKRNAYQGGNGGVT